MVCFCLVLCVGFLAASNVLVSAYTTDFEYTPITWDNAPSVYGYDTSGSYLFGGEMSFLSDNNKYVYNSSILYSNVKTLVIDPEYLSMNCTFAPNLYDYYFVLTVYGHSNFTVVPDNVSLITNDCNTSGKTYYSLTNTKYYHHDNVDQQGFTVVGKMPTGLINTNITGIRFIDNSGGNILRNFYFEGLVISSKKSNDTSAVLSSILTGVEEIIGQNQRIENVTQSVKDAIEEQWNVDNNDDMSTNDTFQKAEEKMGIFTFATDTVVSFVDLFDPDTIDAEGTMLTFPGFKLKVGNQEYRVWHDTQYDLQEIDNHFSGLMTAVRFATVTIVWLALFNYLWKAKDQIFGGGNE